MDSVSAIGFARNILAFVDLGWKIINEALAIYKSTSGITLYDKITPIVAKDVQRLCAVMAARSPASASDLHVGTPTRSREPVKAS